MTVALIAEKIHHRYGSLSVLEGISFTIRQGEILGIGGPSGCGKSTLLAILGGLLQPSQGTVSVAGALPSDSLNPFTYIFQDFALLPWRSVEENVRLPLEHHSLSRADRDARVADALPSLSDASVDHFAAA